jgi:hypothetical protein
MPKSDMVEYKKALLLWRLRRDLTAFKELCLRFDRQGISRPDLRKFLVEINCYYEDLRSRLRY